MPELPCMPERMPYIGYRREGRHAEGNREMHGLRKVHCRMPDECYKQKLDPKYGKSTQIDSKWILDCESERFNK